MRYVTAAALSIALFATDALSQGIIMDTGPVDTSTPRRIRRNPVRLKSHDVRVTVVDQVAQVDVTQVFRNPNRFQVEGVYLFPIPAGAVISDFTMSMGDKQVKGEILDARKARQIYMSIVHRRDDPGLLEYAGRGLIRARIFPIPPMGETKVTLKLAQVRAREAVPDTQRVTLPGDSGIACLHEYRVAIGLGLMAFDQDEEALNLFKNVYQPADKTKKKRRVFSPKVALALASVMLLGLLIVSYVLDLKSPKAIRERIEASTAGMNTTLDALVERQVLIRTVARERPDMLALLKLVNASGEKGVMLNSFNFKKGQKVTITGQVQNNDQLYKFQEKLREHKDLAEVTILSTGKVSGKGSGGSGGKPGSKKGKGITFSITFQYKNFAKKTRTGT
jgi:hypothetical protein